MSDKKFESIKAINDYVCLKTEKIMEEKKDDWKKSESGILMPRVQSNVEPANEKFRVKLIVDSIGDKVENPPFKIGDTVVANDYDMQFISDSDDDENVWVLVKADQIKAVLD